MNVTPYYVDALKELINIGVGRAAGMLNQMLHSHITLHVPFVKIISSMELNDENLGNFGKQKLSMVRFMFKGPFSGSASLVFPPDSAAKLVDVVTGEKIELADLDAVRTGTLTEVGNIVLNGVMGSIGNILKQRLNYSLPIYMENTMDGLLTSNNHDYSPITILLAQTHFTIEQLQIAGDIILFFEVGSFDALLDAIKTISKPEGDYE